MISESLYIAYKQDTSIYAYWLVHTSNVIKMRLNNNRESKNLPKYALQKSNEISTNDFITLTQFLVQQGYLSEQGYLEGETFVYSSLKSAIDKRKSAGRKYDELSGFIDSPELVQSNATHQAFIRAIEQCYSLLNGPEWERNNQVAVKMSVEEVERFVLSKYDILKVEAVEASGDEQISEPEPEPASQQGRGKKGKGKKGGRKGGKKPNKSKNKTETPKTEDDPYKPIPFEDIQIADDRSSYLLATYSAVQQWIELRRVVQDTWEEVAYKGVNSAAAAGVSKVAFSVMSKTNSQMVAHFPEKKTSYLTLINTLTGGGIDNAQGRFQLEASTPEERTNPRVVSDIKEQFLWNMYEILKEFLENHQINRTGKPTQGLKKGLGTWDPKLDLVAASEEERMRWRRSYTIKWLFDLVNVCSTPRRLRNKKAQLPQELEDINWLAANDAEDLRAIFGLNEFAAEITNLAMQNPRTATTKVEEMIQPHHVFQLQCIVDSFTVSKGWYISADAGHRLQQPARFSALRDIDLFMDRKTKRTFGGYPFSLDVLWGLGVTYCPDANSYAGIRACIDEINFHFAKFLGLHVYSKDQQLVEAVAKKFSLQVQVAKNRNVVKTYENEFKDAPPSLFASNAKHGLQEYSPFLCGAGLEEALSLSYKPFMYLWQEMREPLLLIRLYRYLKGIGFLTHRIPLWEGLEILFEKCFFTEEEIKAQRMSAPSAQTNSLLRKLHETTSGTRTYISGSDMHDFWDITKCNTFNLESTMTAYRRVGWDWRQVEDEELRPEEDLRMLSVVGKTYSLRAVFLDQTKISAEGDGGRDRRAEEPSTSEIAPVPLERPAPQTTIHETSTSSTTDPEDLPEFENDKMTEYELLSRIREEFIDDVNGFDNQFHPKRPLLGLNYPQITYVILDVFNRVEEVLEGQREKDEADGKIGIKGNPLYTVNFYETPNEPSKEPSRRINMYINAIEAHRRGVGEGKDAKDAIDLFKLLSKALKTEQRPMCRFSFWGDVLRE
ncbi:hypothetical protein NW768_007245 [Fusarium equiseti]|uniref:DUF6604 domain-containing protein n=1 Tax=Fusarium equiseti TaxID=61235 RepID=A0ABQ8RAH0_FUSEQ|nr:hypothetical protein NW768_007245 [Fusarium equiseti]